MVALILMLFAFWVILSGKFDAFHLAIGAVSTIGVTLGTRRLFLLSPAIGPGNLHPMDVIPWIRLLRYIPWLIWQIITSSLQVAFVVLHPKMPIQPSLIRFRTHLPHELARLTLATSITMTPGTVTLDVQEDEFLIHALTDKSALGLLPIQGESNMQRHVQSLYQAASAMPQETVQDG